MCMEDIRIGRDTFSNVRAFAAATGADTLLVAPSRNRIMFRVGISNNTLFIVPFGIDGNLNQAFFLNLTKPDLEFNIQTHGDLVRWGWNYRTGAACNIIVVETFLKKE